MSWQGYVDTNLVGTGKISQAAIIGLKGGVWATSADFNVSVRDGDGGGGEDGEWEAGSGWWVADGG